MKTRITITILLLLSSLCFAHEYTQWKAPVSKETNKITYSGIIEAKGIDKGTIFRRLKKFVALKDFDKVENIKCKDKTLIITKFYEKAIRYEDDKDGIIIGNGYMPVLWRKFNYIWVVYQFKINAQNGICKYEITEFKTLNFFSAPKIKSRGSASAFGSYGYIFGSSSSTSTMNTTKMENVPLELYIDGKGERDSYNTYFRDNPEIFLDEMNSVIKTLKNSISDEF